MAWIKGHIVKRLTLNSSAANSKVITGLKPFSLYKILVVPFTIKGLANYSSWTGVNCLTSEAGKTLCSNYQFVYFFEREILKF